MIPTFPEFKNLEWSDREAVEQITSCFPPYSDFNFVSMWAWNTRDKMMISGFHGNLILLFYDYLTEQPFLSFIGKNNVANTARELIAYSERWYQTGTLRLIPESVAVQPLQEEFTVREDEDSHDYILSVPYLKSLDILPNSHEAARLCKKFLQLYPHHVVKNHSIKENAGEEYIDLFRRWAKIKNLDHWELNEYSAFEKFINNKDSDNHIISLYDNNRMMGFATYEILPQGYAVCHFAKADRDYKGVYDGLYFSVGTTLQKLNIDYWNFEQDLGISGLRRSKRKYKPAFYLKKFIVEKKNENE